MGASITKLVFRPPSPATQIQEDKFFYLKLPSTTTNDVGCAPQVGCSIVPPNLEKDSHNDEFRIPAFFLLRRDAKMTLLYSHGNAEDLGMMYNRMKELARVLGCNVMAYEYAGYGLSEPQTECSEDLCYRSIDAAYSYLVNVMKIPPKKIVLYGRSLGSGPSCYMAKKTADEGKSVGGLILHSPFLSIYRVVLDVKSGYVGDMFQSYTRAKDIRCPVFVIHGRQDRVVPFWHAPELLKSFHPQYRAAPMFVDMGHNAIEIHLRFQYIKNVQNFLEMCSSRGTVPEDQRFLPSVTLEEEDKSFFSQKWAKRGRRMVLKAIRSKDDDILDESIPEHCSSLEIKDTDSAKKCKSSVSFKDKLISKIHYDDDDYEDDFDTDEGGSFDVPFIESLNSWETNGTDIKDVCYNPNVEVKLAQDSLSASIIQSGLKKMALGGSVFETNMKRHSTENTLHGKKNSQPLYNVTNSNEHQKSTKDVAHYSI